MIRLREITVLFSAVLLLILPNHDLAAQTNLASVDLLKTTEAGTARPLLVKNAKIVDLKKREILSRSIVIKEGKIQKRLKETPSNFEGEVLNADGKWIIPGLFDMHVHSSSNKSLKFKDMPPIKTENSAKVMLYAGLTGFLDLFGNEDYLFNLRERQDKGKFVGAEVFAAGPILTSPNGHGTQFHTETRTVSSPDNAKAVVQSLSKENPDVIKIVYNPGQVASSKKMTSMDKSTMQSLIAEANKLDFKTVVHFGTWEDAYEVVKAGATAITHVRPKPVPDSLVSLMKKKDTKWIPTLSVYTEAFRYFRNPHALEKPLLQKVTSSELRNTYRTNVPKKAKVMAEKKGPSIEKKMLENFKKLHTSGIDILAGTDAGNRGVFQGYTLHRELQLYVKAGMTPWEALSTATLNATNFLDFSSGIQVGNRADFVILNSSPINSINNTKDIWKVIYKGQITEREKLLKNTRLSE